MDSQLDVVQFATQSARLKQEVSFAHVCACVQHICLSQTLHVLSDKDVGQAAVVPPIPPLVVEPDVPPMPEVVPPIPPLPVEPDAPPPPELGRHVVPLQSG